ncbi:MAG TPA: class I SAM-dependent methyltransferase [Candidatus Nanopelagicales bacterium]|nr:class I SAM-dependent methyltransferase [Candidatus Nanopelagicales bacterium]
MEAAQWDAKYAERDLVWSAGPNVFVERYAADLPVGRALDVAGGEGRNALWLADRGWDATVADFSQVALDRALRIRAERPEKHGVFGVRRVDVLAAPLGAQDFDLVVVAYLQLAGLQRRVALRSAADAVAPGGHLLVVAHHTDNLADGYGGPQNPMWLYSEADVLDDLEGTGLAPQVAERAARTVHTDDGDRIAWDVVVLATRP